MKKLIEAKKITLALLMLIVLTSLITFNACKEDVVEPKNPVTGGEGDGDVNLQELLGDAPLCTFRFYTRTVDYTMPIPPYTDKDIPKKQIFHGFNVGFLTPDWRSYKPAYLKLNGEDWPYDGGYNYLNGGQQGYIEDINVVMDYEGVEFQWNEKNIPEIDFDFNYTDTIEIDRSKPFYVKYSGGNSGAQTTKINFNGAGRFNRILTEDNGNIAIPPEILQQFPAGIVGIVVGITRNKEMDTKHCDREVRINIDNVQGSGFVAKFK